VRASSVILKYYGNRGTSKLEPIFACTVVIGGALMGLSLAAQILLSLYEMWLKKVGQNQDTTFS
jgi:hypothetical protein